MSKDLGIVHYVYQSGEEQKVECKVNVTNKDKAATGQSIDKAVDSFVKKLSVNGLFNVSLNLEFKRGALRLVSASDPIGNPLPIDMEEIDGTETPQEPIKITLKDRSMETSHLELIDYFSRKKTGKIGPIDQLINWLNSKFEQVETWFSQITGLSEKKLKRDFKLLSSVIGQYSIDKPISLKESLSYIGKMLEKEEHELASYVKAAEQKAKKIEGFRSAKMNRPTKTYNKFVGAIQTELKTLQPGKKVLLPLSYQEKDKWQEFCLEIEAQEKGKCRVRLISNNPRLAEVFGKEGEAQFLLHTRDGVDVAELVERLPALIAIQVWQDMGLENSRSLKTKLFAFGIKAASSIIARLLEKFGPKDKSTEEMVAGLKAASKPTLNNLELFKSLLVFEGAKVAQPQGKKAPKASAGSLGSFGEMMTYVKHLRPSDHQRFETSAQLELFLQTTEGSRKWLQNETFRAIALSSARKLLTDIEENKALFFGIDEEHQASELKKNVSRLEAVIQKVENYRPKNPRFGSKSFSSKLSGLVANMPFVGLQKGVFKKGIVSTSKGANLPPFPDVVKDEAPTISKQAEILKDWNKRAEALVKIGALDQLQQELIEMSSKFPSINDSLWESVGVRNTPVYQQMKQEGENYVEARLPAVALRLKPVFIARLDERIPEVEKKIQDLSQKINDLHQRELQEPNKIKKEKLSIERISTDYEYQSQKRLLEVLEERKLTLIKTNNPDGLLQEFDNLNTQSFTSDYLLLGNTLAKEEGFLRKEGYQSTGRYSLGELLNWDDDESKVFLTPLYELRAAVVKDIYQPNRDEFIKDIKQKNSEIETFCTELEKLCGHWMKAFLPTVASGNLRAESYLSFLTFVTNIERATSNYYDVSINGNRPLIQSTFRSMIPIKENMQSPDFIYPEDEIRFMELKKFLGRDSYGYELKYCRDDYQKEQKVTAAINPDLVSQKNKLLEIMEHVGIWGSVFFLNPLSGEDPQKLERLRKESSLTPSFNTPFFSRAENLYIGSTNVGKPIGYGRYVFIRSRPEVKNYQLFSDQLYKYGNRNGNRNNSNYLPELDHKQIYEPFFGKETANGVWTESEARDFFSLKATLTENQYEAYNRAHKRFPTDGTDSLAYEAALNESPWARERVNQTFSVFARHPNFWGRAECRRLMEQNLEEGWKLVPVQDRLQIIRGMQEGIQVLNRIGDVRGLASIYAIYDWIYVDAVKNHSMEELELLEQLLGQGGGLPKLQELSSQHTQAKNQRDIHREVLALYYNRYRKDVQPLSQFSDVDVQLLLIANLKTNLFPPNIDNDDPTITWKGQQMIHLVLPILQQKTEKETFDFVRHMMKNGFNLDLEWKLAKDGFPGFAAQTVDGHHHVLDLRTGMHAIDGSATTLIPISLLQQPLIVEKFKFLAEMKTLVGTVEGRTDVNGVVKKCYTPAQYPDYQIVIDESGSGDNIQILRKIKDEKGKEIACLYVDADDLLSPKAEKKAEQKATYKDPLWGEDIGEPEEKPLWKETPKERQDIRSFVRAGIGKNACWRSLEDSNKIFVADGKDSPYALLTLRAVDKKNPASDKEIDKWKLISEQNISLLDTSKATDEFQFLAHIERGDRILSYGQRGHVVMTEFPKLLRLNGLPLRYRISKNRIMLGNDTSFVIKNTSLSGMPSAFKNYHLFENSRGEKKVLAAQRELRPFKELSSDVAGMQEAVFTDAESIVYEWDVDPETGLPKSDSVEGNLYLAYLFMSHQDYGSALEYLKKARPQTMPSKEYEDILKWIRGSADRSFEATVFRLAMETQLEKALGQWTETEEGRQERLNNVKKMAMEWALHIEKNPNLKTSGFFQQIDMDEVMKMVHESDTDVQLAQQKDFRPAGNLNSKQPFVADVIADKIEQEEHPQFQIGQLSLQSFVLNLWTESNANRKISLPYDYRTRFSLDPKGWLIKDFFAIVRALDSMDKNSVAFKELSHTILRSHPFMEQDKLGLLLDKKTSLKRMRYMEARSYLLAIINERKKGVSETAKIFKTLEDKLVSSSKPLDQKKVEKAYERDLKNWQRSTRESLSKTCMSGLKKLHKPIDKVFALYNKAYKEREDRFDQGIYLVEKENEFEKLQSDALKLDSQKSQIEGLMRIFSTKDKEADEGELAREYKSGLVRLQQSTQQMLDEVNELYNIALEERNALWAKNSALTPEKEEALNKLKKEKERLLIQENLVEEFIQAVSLQDAEFEKFNEDFIKEYLGKDVEALNEASSKLVKLNSELRKVPVGFVELPPDMPVIEESKETLMTKEIEKRFKDLPRISLTGNLEGQIEDLQTKIEEGKLQAKADSPKEGGEKPVFSLGNSIPVAVSQQIQAPDNIKSVFDFFQDPIQDPIVKKQGEAHRQDLASYLSENEIVVPVLTKDHVRAASQKVAALKLEKAKEKEQLKDSIMAVASKFVEHESFRSLKVRLGKEIAPGFDRLLGLYLSGELLTPGKDNALRKLGVNITEAELKILNENIQKFLITATELQHAKKTLELLEKARNEFKKSKQLDETLNEELYQMLTAKRVYDPLTNPYAAEFMMIEYKNGFLMRDEQKKTVIEMLEKPGAIRQLIMGGGKSKVLLPILAKRMANGQNLMMVVVPESLFAINKKDLTTTAKELFGQDVYVFDFNRQTPTDKEGLLKIHLGLLQTIDDKGFIASTKANLLAYRHAYHELGLKFKDNPTPELAERIKIMANTLDLLKQRGVILADEVDTILDVKKEVNYSVGAPQKLSEDKKNGAVQMMKYMLESDRLKKALKVDGQATLTSKVIQEELERVAGRFYDEEEISGWDKENFIAYMMGKDVDVIEGNLPAPMLELKTNKPDLYKKIAIARQYISVGFTHSLQMSKSTTSGYGRDPDGGVWTIPSASGNISRNSNFDDEIERVCVTLQDYISGGISIRQAEQMVEQLKSKAKKELQDDVEGELTTDETEAGKLFKQSIEQVNKLLPTEKQLPSSLQYFGHEQITEFTKAISSNPELLLEYCNRFVLDHMEFAPQQLIGTPQDLVSMVHDFKGFTGTLWNAETFHDSLNPQKAQGVDGKTYTLLLGRKKPNITVIDLQAEDPLSSLFNDQLNLVGKYNALIDLGGYLKGKKSEDFVAGFEKTLKNNPSSKIKGCAYVDSSTGEVMVKRRGDKGKPTSLNEARDIQPEERITFYDQARTVGTDIVQGKKAKALVTIGENTFTRDLFQAVWRMRKLAAGQSVDLCISRNIAERIKNLCYTEEEKQKDVTLDIEHVLRFCLLNEALRCADDNFRSAVQKISSEIPLFLKEEAVQLGKTIDAADPGAFIELFQNNLAAFVRERSQGEKLVDAYATVAKMEDPVEVLKGMLPDDASPDQYKDLLNGERYRLKVKKAETAGGNEVQAQVQAQAQAETESQALSLVQTEVEVNTFAPHREVTANYQNLKSEYFDAHFNGDPMIAFAQQYRSYNAWGYPDNTRRYIHNLNVNPQGYERLLYSQIFDRRINVSCNIHEDRTHALTKDRKPIYEALFGRNVEGKMIAIMVALHDQKVAHEYAEETDKVRLVRLGIDKNIFISGGIDLPEEDKNDFLQLYVQCKLFSGQLTYTSPGEKEALLNWMQGVRAISNGKSGIAAVKECFENEILPSLPNDQREAYGRSQLRTLLNHESRLKEVAIALQKAPNLEGNSDAQEILGYFISKRRGNLEAVEEAVRKLLVDSAEEDIMAIMAEAKRMLKK